MTNKTVPTLTVDGYSNKYLDFFYSYDPDSVKEIESVDHSRDFGLKVKTKTW